MRCPTCNSLMIDTPCTEVQDDPPPKDWRCTNDQCRAYYCEHDKLFWPCAGAFPLYYTLEQFENLTTVTSTMFYCLHHCQWEPRGFNRCWDKHVKGNEWEPCKDCKYKYQGPIGTTQFRQHIRTQDVVPLFGVASLPGQQAEDIAYTVGAVKVYDEYMSTDKEAAKAVGGTVWKTYEDAKGYLDSVGGHVTLASLEEEDQRVPAAVYAVFLPHNWEADTQEVPGCKYRQLKVPAKIASRIIDGNSVFAAHVHKDKK